MTEGAVFGVIGCGSVATQLYLPALRRVTDAPGIAVDTVPDRARAAAWEFDLVEAASDYESALAEIEVAFVCTPPATHAEIARDCLERGIPVLTEKPIATSRSAGQDLVATARDLDVPCAVMRNWRSRNVIAMLREAIEDGAVGPVESTSLLRGKELGWVYQSGYRFDRDRAGGILPDIGPHAIDVCCWLFGDDLEVCDYTDDFLGGVEANLALWLRADDVDLEVRLSHTRDLDNGFVVTGRDGRIEAPLLGDEIAIVDEDGNSRTLKVTDAPRDRSEVDRIVEQIRGFLGAVERDEPVPTPAETGLPILSVIEACYERREITPHPWERVSLSGFDGGKPG